MRPNAPTMGTKRTQVQVAAGRGLLDPLSARSGTAGGAGLVLADDEGHSGPWWVPLEAYSEGPRQVGRVDAIDVHPPGRSSAHGRVCGPIRPLPLRKDDEARRDEGALPFEQARLIGQHIALAGPIKPRNIRFPGSRFSRRGRDLARLCPELRLHVVGFLCGRLVRLLCFAKQRSSPVQVSALGRFLGRLLD